MSQRISWSIACLVGLGLTAPVGLAQGAAASPGYFLTGSENGPGAVRMQSASFHLDSGVGSGVVASRAASSAWVLEGSWLAIANGSHRGSPWVTGVVPPFTSLGGGTAHRVVGTELDLGPATTCSVGGIAATVSARRVDELQVGLGTQRVPGWHPVVVQNAGGTSTLVRGIGVRPLIDLEVALDDQGSRRSSVLFHGERGDLVLWAVAAGRSPFPIPLPGYGYGLGLDFVSLLVFASSAADADGRAVLPIPAVRFQRPLLLQGLVLTSTGSYRPGAFTNVLDF